MGMQPSHWPVLLPFAFVENTADPLGSLHIYIDHSRLAEHHARGEHHKPSMQFSAVGSNIEVLGLTIASIL